MTRFGLTLAAVVLLLDQVSKWWILEMVMQPPQIIPLLPFFNLVLVKNFGVSFGMFAGLGAIWPLVAIALVIMGGLTYWLRSVENRLLATGLGFVIGGAAGNVIDRFRYGAVIDFLDFHAAGWHWPAFNLADAAITVGAAIILLESFLAQEDRDSQSGA
ncbi:MAG: signal peptidase II [Rhodospirillaceae bacterium]|jgi:signal peptidase II|nr:signal peptidase II [Rhodospirillaceae bacterium]MBT5373424.1 signal peptidase II [Rhodospirillaceae bacterium]MBT5658661.1 signal peptidase II [Rhodospirillaceae bacterium]MBT5752120.1 signal peptidase II [Rhodospirillaceae bacterium]